MVAKVNSGKTIVGILNYNENKVKAGNAECLEENMFGVNPKHLSFYDKLRGFQTYMARNRRATTNAVHISLNFHPTESLDKDKLLEISSTYMHRIGFGEQPYLVYQHHDAAHQHLHIVTTNITWSGDRISLHNLGKDKSEKARKEIERLFNLVRAGTTTQRESKKPEPVIYGKSESRQSVSAIVSHVTRSYKFTSLPELNAVLHQFNIHADRGKETSAMFQRRGLLFRILATDQSFIGVPFKASSLPGKPTLDQLEKQFKVNEILRGPLRRGLTEKVSHALTLDHVRSVDDLALQLKKHQVDTVIRSNAEGRMYGITFVDHKTRTVFNGSDLGKTFSISNIQKTLNDKTPVILTSPLEPSPRRSFNVSDKEAVNNLQDAITQLVQAEPMDFTSPAYALRLRRRKRKKRRPI